MARISLLRQSVFMSHSFKPAALTLLALSFSLSRVTFSFFLGAYSLSLWRK